MASNSKALPLITVLFFLFLLSTQSILPSTARKILGTNQNGSGGTISAAEKVQSAYKPEPDPGFGGEGHGGPGEGGWLNGG